MNKVKEQAKLKIIKVESPKPTAQAPAAPAPTTQEPATASEETSTTRYERDNSLITKKMVQENNKRIEAVKSSEKSKDSTE